MGDRYPRFIAAAVQASPVFLDREGTVQKACKLIEEAAAAGARLIVFPEAYIPTFPYWPRAFPHPNRHLSIAAFVELYKNSVEIPSQETEALCAAAQHAGAYVVMGLNERGGYGGTLYNTLLYIDDKGNIMGKHRKLVPTFDERCVWGYGDGSGLKVYTTELGRLSGLICGNNLMPLVRYALFAQGEQIHAAVWPEMTRHKDKVDVVCRNYAYEGQVFVVVASGYITKEMVPDSFVLKEQTVWEVCGGSAIIDPEGRYLAGPVYDREEVVLAEIDLEMVIRAKAMQDVVGHYARSDIASLLLNEEEYLPMRPVKEPLPTRVLGEGAATIAQDTTG